MDYRVKGWLKLQLVIFVCIIVGFGCSDLHDLLTGTERSLETYRMWSSMMVGCIITIMSESACVIGLFYKNLKEKEEEDGEIQRQISDEE